MSTPASTPMTAGTRRLIPLNQAMPWIIAAVFLVILPYVFDSRSAITIMNQMAITIVFALSYNMLLGQGGMLSFGHAVYMGLGGFFAMHVLNWQADDPFLPLPLLPVFGGLFGLLFAFLIGWFSTRRAGTTFAMISLGVGQLVASLSIIIVIFFGGEEGVSGDRTSAAEIFGRSFGPNIEVYYLTAIWLVIAALGMYLYSRTPIGRIANAVRDNEERAEFLGYSQRNVRWISFCASDFFAGIAGALFAINFEILTEENLNLVTSGEILLVTFLGGVGFFVGPIIGAIVFTLLKTVMGLYTEIWALYLGILFVATVMFFPSGLAGLLALHVLPWKLGRLGRLAVPYAKMLLPAVGFVIGSAVALEILFHMRNAAVGEDEMQLFGITFDGSNPLYLGGAVAVAVLSAVLLSRLTPGLKAAWSEATHVDGRQQR